MLVTGNNIVTENKRLTIQLGLSGFSFIISDLSGNTIDKGEHKLPSSSRNFKDFKQDIQSIICSDPLLNCVYELTHIYYRTEKYTLTPKEYFNKEEAAYQLCKVHNLKDNDKVLSEEIKEIGAFIAFAIPEKIIELFKNIFYNIDFYPSSLLLLKNMDKIKEKNLIRIERGYKQFDLAVFYQGKLKLINSFPISDFNSMLYFLILVTQEVVFNPKLTTIKIGGIVSEDIITKLSTYFNKVILCE